MNVLHVIPSLGPLRGGPSYALRALARELARQGVSAHICATDDNGPSRLDVPLGRPLREDGVTTWFFPRQTRFYTFSWPLTYWLARRVREYDLIHIHALFSYASLRAALYAAYHRVPYIVRPLGTLNRWGMTHRRPLLKQASFRLVERRILAGAASIHFTSEDEREQAREVGVDGPSAVIPPGVDMTQFEHLPPEGRFFEAHPHLAGRPIVLFLSRLDAKKGLDLLLPAFREVQRGFPDAALVIAGSGEETLVAELRRQAEQLEIAESVAFVGFLEGADKLAALAAASVFALPSYSENFGIACVEALAAGLPVVLSNQVAVAPAVEQRGAGLAVQTDVDDLARALKRLLGDPVARSRMSEQARKLARDQFSLEATGQQLIGLYRGILDGRDTSLQLERSIP